MRSHRTEPLGVRPGAALEGASTRITVAARLDRLPKSRYIRKLIILLSLGACFEFYDLFFSAYIAPALYSSGIFSPTTKGFLGFEGFASFVGALFAGLYVGTLVFSPIADRLGRRAIFIWFIRRAIPESPRWLEQQGRIEEAERIMEDIEQRVRSETGAALPEPQLVEGDVYLGRGSLRDIWSKSYRPRTALLVAFHVLQPVGYYGFASWVPTLLLAEGVNITQSLKYTFVMALASPLGPLVGMAFADVFECKWQIACSALSIAICGLLLAKQRHVAVFVVIV